MAKTKFEAFLEDEATLDGSIIIKGKISNASDDEKKAVGPNSDNLLKVEYADIEDGKSNHILLKNNSNNVGTIDVNNSFLKLKSSANVFVETNSSTSNSLTYKSISLSEFKILPTISGVKRPKSQGTQSIIGSDWKTFCK